ncbi:hypothetical protein A2348_03455 [Candidatus Uhrbacteria bacterium RIFOXYB12_FULL_58_10]|uniref:Uncharacterized protein n=1 Tax=Candidatus Uhrbacteria bacterium RIFOXYB2_FULL_57_15 TaxID=1802422 RepID=A0A1F7W5N4_9BACT|nr:MAG: hypothetical protein A2348_03455 [Candidatus Uhrbacteria bacterium RIFOXYB12_FULL_58_10]OGL98122.1 MAG: hypothetical protein A2304_03505 [Candidatus Uhrbacteria bacterium RIFOXYB2_FULL_57_15]OGM00106.1 MAG: hypothetical protein A2501_01160 [Candidatus Uhrbacteria bacterium RIFOXYC12_FULL_57_11]
MGLTVVESSTFQEGIVSYFPLSKAYFFTVKAQAAISDVVTRHFGAMPHADFLALLPSLKGQEVEVDDEGAVRLGSRLLGRIVLVRARYLAGEGEELDPSFSHIIALPGEEEELRVEAIKKLDTMIDALLLLRKKFE